MAKKRRKFSKEHLANLRAAHAARRGKKRNKKTFTLKDYNDKILAPMIKNLGPPTHEPPTGPYKLSNLDSLYDELQKTIDAKIEKLNQLI